MKKLVLMLAFTGAPTGALAQSQTCDAYVGQTVTPRTFDAVAAALKRIPAAKGEYETTADYEARLAVAQGASGSVAIVGYRFDPKYLKYDADAGALNVVAYALQNVNTDYSRVFGYGSDLYNKVEFNSYDNIDIVVSQSETTTGSYIGENAFGARATIYKRLRVDKAIFQGKGNYTETLWPTADKDQRLGSIPMSIEEAKAFKATGKAAVVAAPKWPFFAEGTAHAEGDLSSRSELTNPAHVIVADIQCGLLLTSANKVVAAYPTR